MSDTSIIEAGHLATVIHVVREHRVMIDADLARLYGVQTKALVRAVQRNARRFPKDFMFQLTADEALRCQIGTSKKAVRGGRRYLPYAFTEQGVSMLSSVLRSDRAIDVNIEIMRAFVALRGLLASNTALQRKLDALERKYDASFSAVFAAIRKLMATTKAKPTLGFARRKVG